MKGASTRVVDVAAGERRQILRRVSNSVAMAYRFRAEPVDDGGRVSGLVEVRGSNWIFPKPPTTQPLEADNTVDKGAWDTFFSVVVIPDGDVRIAMEDRTMRSGRLLAGIVAAIVALAIAVAALAAMSS